MTDTIVASSDIFRANGRGVFLRCGRLVAIVLVVMAAEPLLSAEGARGARAPAAEEARRPVKAYPTRYYIIHTDLPIDRVREAAARLTAMAEEYYRRTRGFAGTIDRRLPFYLFGRKKDYHAAGAPLGTGGVFMGTKLMALATKDIGRRVWHIVQHEGFHQFAHFVIGPTLPVWVNEGLAEYFGHGIWTGDGLVTGVIPPKRMKRIQTLLEADKMLSTGSLLTMRHREWNAARSRNNYDQSWSMAHFLVHAEDGKYRGAFSKYIRDLATGRPREMAFTNRFGRNIKAFEQRYSQWWLSLSADPTAERRVVAVVQTLMSFLARAKLCKRTFADSKEFLAWAREGKPLCPPEQWLPAALLARAAAEAEKLDGWSLDTPKARPKLILKRPDGTLLVGTYRIRRRRITDVTVTTRRPRPVRKRPTAWPRQKRTGRFR